LLNLNPHNELDDVSPQRRRDVMRKAATLIKPYMRDEDVLARYNDTTFGFLLPDMIGERAKETIDDLQMLVAGTPVDLERDGMRINIDASAGVAAYHGTVAERDVEADDLLAQAMRALKQAELATYGKVLLLPPGPSEYGEAGHNGANGQIPPVGMDPHRTQRL
jgi:diguanylate cyclase (GGDEF)-like protein